MMKYLLVSLLGLIWSASHRRQSIPFVLHKPTVASTHENISGWVKQLGQCFSHVPYSVLHIKGDVQCGGPFNIESLYSLFHSSIRNILVMFHKKRTKRYGGYLEYQFVRRSYRIFLSAIAESLCSIKSCTHSSHLGRLLPRPWNHWLDILPPEVSGEPPKIITFYHPLLFVISLWIWFSRTQTIEDNTSDGSSKSASLIRSYHAAEKYSARSYSKDSSMNPILGDAKQPPSEHGVYWITQCMFVGIEPLWSKEQTGVFSYDRELDNSYSQAVCVYVCLCTHIHLI